MEQNQVQTDLSAFRDPFRYNTFHGFNSHNHIVVTEVGDVATGVAARTGGRITVTLDSSIQFLRPGKDTSKLVAHGRVVKEGRTTGLVTAEVFNDAGELLATASVMVYYVDENAYADETMQ